MMKLHSNFNEKHFVKVFFIAALFLGIATKSDAQGLGAASLLSKAKNLPKKSIGIKFGSNFSYLSGDTWSNGIKSNLIGGGFAGIRWKRFGMQGELLFVQSEYTTGNGFYNLYSQYYNNLGDSLQQGTFRINQLALPLFLQFRVAGLFWIQTGVQFYGIVSVRDFNGLVSESKRLFKAGNTAGILGISVRLGNADIGVRTLFDFHNLNRHNAADVWKQYTLQASIGVKIF